MLWHRGGPGDARPPAPGVQPRAHFCTFVRSLLPLTSQFPLLSRPARPAVGSPGLAPADLLLALTTLGPSGRARRNVCTFGENGSVEREHDQASQGDQGWETGLGWGPEARDGGDWLRKCSFLWGPPKPASPHRLPPSGTPRFSPCLARHMLYHGRQTWSSWTLGALRAVESPETPGENNGLIWGAFSCVLGHSAGCGCAVLGSAGVCPRFPAACT